MRKSICQAPNKKILLPDFSAKTIFLESNTNSITHHELTQQSKSHTPTNSSSDYGSSDNSFSSQNRNKYNRFTGKRKNLNYSSSDNSFSSREYVKQEKHKPTLIIDILTRNNNKQIVSKETDIFSISPKRNSLFIKNTEFKPKIAFVSERRKTREYKVKFTNDVFLSDAYSKEKLYSNNISFSSKNYIATEESIDIRNKNTRHSSKTFENDICKEPLNLKKNSEKELSKYKLYINRCSPEKSAQLFSVDEHETLLSSKSNKLLPLKKSLLSMNSERVISSLIKDKNKASLNLKSISTKPEQQKQRVLLTK